MNERHQVKRHKIKHSWQPAWSAIALGLGIFGISAAPAQSLPRSAAGQQIAQVSGRSRVTPANTPLNVTPRFHIPLPTNSRSSDYYRQSGYRDGYGHYHHHDGHGHHHHREHRGHRRQGPVIIINPATSSSYSDYSSQNGYIRVIRK